jgi:excisionase family DNA binding protein
MAQLLDCSTQQVRVLFHLGEIPGGFQVRKLIRFQRDVVDRWLEERKAAAGRATA